MRKVVVVNFAHPITDAQREQIKEIAGADEVEVVGEGAQFDLKRPLRPQVSELFNRVMGQVPRGVGFNDMIFNLPSLNYAAAVMMQLIMDRYDAVPDVLRLRSVDGALPPRFEVAEII